MNNGAYVIINTLQNKQTIDIRVLHYKFTFSYRIMQNLKRVKLFSETNKKKREKK